MSVKNRNSIVTDGLVFYVDAGNANSYPGSGTTWNDLAGGNDGTFSATPTTDSANGGSIVFDGVDDYVDIGNDSALSPANFSFSVWANLNNTNDQTFIGKTASKNYGFGLYNGYVYLLILTSAGWGGNDSTVPINGNVSINTWHNFLGTYDGSTLKLYIDNTLKGTTSRSGPIVYNTDNTRIGHIGAGINSFYVNGDIANVQIYNRALSASEITQNYNALKNRFI